MFDKFGRTEGFGQQAPGRDLRNINKARKRPDQPPQAGADLQAAIMGPPAGGGMMTPGPSSVPPPPIAGGFRTPPDNNNVIRNAPKDYLSNQQAGIGAGDGSGSSLDALLQLKNNTGINGGKVPSGVDQLAVNGKPSMMDASNGGINGAGLPPQSPGSVPETAAAAAQRQAGTYKTRLMEGDQWKLDPANNHQAKSPKYDFLQLANTNKYDYTQMGDMVKELQAGPNARFWQGWDADGKGNLLFKGDPSQLAPEWNGVRSVDAVGAYGNLSQGKDASGWRWGADEKTPGMGGGGQGSPADLQSAIMGLGGGLGQTVDGSISGEHTQSLRDQIMQALQVDPRLKELGKTYGY